MEYLIKTIKKWEDEIFAIVCSLIVFSVLCFFWSKKEEYPFINNFFTESACDTYEIDRDIDQERRKYYENLRKENGKGKVWDEKYAEFNSWRLKNEGVINK